MKLASFYKESIESPELFWSKEAQKIKWFKQPEKIISKDEAGLSRWFEKGTLNTCYLALDQHVESGRGEDLALIYDSPVTDVKQTYTYRALLTEVARFAGVLKQLGVIKGDRVIIYMPMMPEVVIAMLACARLGAIHSVVFGGFAAHELAIRIDDAKPKVLLAASGGIEIKKIIPYKPTIDQAIEEAQHKIEHCVVFQRDFVQAELKDGRDLDWKEVLLNAKPATWVMLDAWDPLYILYTSGTTGQPKGIVRDNGGHAVALRSSMEYVYGVNAGDVFWAASDVGWVVGHSYIVYAPLISGATTVVFEGKPIRTPDASTFWRVIDEYNVKTMFTAPTAIRAIKKEDPNGELKEKYALNSFTHLFLAGERTDVATYNWASKLLNVPIIDHWWQTESGWPMLANLAGIELLPVKPGSACKPVFGYDVVILNPNNEVCAANEEGGVAVKLPLPPGCLPTLWNDNERFNKSYMMKFPGYYFSGDGGYMDDDGYVYITGRIDDIINVAGHRLSTAEMEEVLAMHPAVAECAVVGIADELKGQVPVGLVVVKANSEVSDLDLEKELIASVRSSIGPVASFKMSKKVKRLPKTRSGKILRKIIRNIADGTEFKPPSTIEDITVLDELKEMMRDNKLGNAFREA